MEDDTKPAIQADVEAAEVSSSEAKDEVTENKHHNESKELDSEEEAPEQETEESEETRFVPIAIIDSFDLTEPSDQFSDLICGSVMTLLAMNTQQSTVHNKTIVRLVTPFSMNNSTQ